MRRPRPIFCMRKSTRLLCASHRTRNRLSVSDRVLLSPDRPVWSRIGFFFIKIFSQIPPGESTNASGVQGVHFSRPTTAPPSGKWPRNTVAVKDMEIVIREEREFGVGPIRRRWCSGAPFRFVAAGGWASVGRGPKKSIRRPSRLPSKSN